MSQHLKEQLEQAREYAQALYDNGDDTSDEIRAAWIRSHRKILDSILHDMSRPFDPTECGFENVESGGILNRQQWANGMHAITLDGGYGLIEEIGGSSQWEFPWPESHFDGIQLLISLGVVEK